MLQRWHDLLFAHWPVPAAALAPRLPPGLELDTFDGRAWLGVVPFRMTGVRVAGLPPVPGAGAFPELNVRTYVTHGETRGVWFFSLDAASGLAVAVARAWLGLPYFRARMECARDGATVEYASRRTDRRGAAVGLRARYGPVGLPGVATGGSLEDFLTRRMTLFTARRGHLLRCDVEHASWPLQPARADILENSMGLPLGQALREPPASLLFARDLEVRVSAPWRVE